MTLIVLAERASALAETRTELLLGVSHELCTPLTITRVTAGNLRKGLAPDNDPAREYGEIIGAEAQRLSAMIEDMLMFAQMQFQRWRQLPLRSPPSRWCEMRSRRTSRP